MYIVMHKCHNLEWVQVRYLEYPRFLKKWICVTVISFIVDCSLGSFLNNKLFLAFPHAIIPYVICGWSNEKYSVCKLSMGREHFTCFITNMAFEILLLVLDSYFLHDRDSSKVIPRNLHEVTLLNITLSICRLCADKSRFLCGGFITI